SESTRRPPLLRPAASPLPRRPQRSVRRASRRAGQEPAVSVFSLALLAAGPSRFEIGPAWGLFLALLLVALNGFFVAAEFALVKVRPTQIEPYIAEGNRRARLARHMLRHLDAYLSATQLGITLASLALGWIGEPAFAWVVRPVVELIAGRGNEQIVHSVSLTISFLSITVLHIVLGEQAPKTIAIRKAEKTSLLIAFPLYAFYKVTYPVIWLLNRAANALLTLIRVAPANEGELPRRGGAAAPARLQRSESDLPAEARAARQRLRAVAPDGPPGHAAPPG